MFSLKNVNHKPRTTTSFSVRQHLLLPPPLYNISPSRLLPPSSSSVGQHLLRSLSWILPTRRLWQQGHLAPRCRRPAIPLHTQPNGRTRMTGQPSLNC
ncbi:uncharacterized protein LOC126619617 isoform X2 [Malus sylvestris]|uniref:uncharacterized protein LOC126619617 isoform X2 n=1 Tax=Malus sylvestris TaxID=3752 RepID=UPI0021AD12F7|nr:uncharacterized protein LOC126619617 isoform X2 [Malus sylvestris]